MFSPTARRSGLMDRSTLGPNEEKGAILFGSIATGASANDMVACTGLVASCLMVRPSWLLTISAGSVASPTAMTTASGLNGYVYTSAATAPACCASVSLSWNIHVPRRISAMLPLRLFAGSGAQASPVESSFSEISTSGAVMGLAGSGSSAGTSANEPWPPTANGGATKYRSLFIAPMVMASGAVPGDAIVLGSGPALPADMTTMTPIETAFSITCTSGSLSIRGAGTDRK